MFARTLVTLSDRTITIDRFSDKTIKFQHFPIWTWWPRFNSGISVLCLSKLRHPLVTILLKSLITRYETVIVTKPAHTVMKITWIHHSEMSPVKWICVFEHSVMTNFNCASPAIQRGQGSGLLSEGSSWFTACMSEQRRFWRDCADAQARLNLRCSHRQ